MFRSAVEPDAIFSQFRRETSVLHRLVESKLEPVFAELDRDRYVGLLQAFHGFIAPWEERLHQVVDAESLEFFATRRHTARLEADLNTFASAAPLAVADTSSCMHDTATAIGSAYVIEGSMLGGQILSRRVSASLGLTDGIGCRYFAGYANRTGIEWRNFQAFSEERMRQFPQSAVVSACDSARNTFGVLHDWLVHCGVVS